MAIKSMTYGTMPSQLEYHLAFNHVCPDGKFLFHNDPRVGTDVLGETALWQELNKALSDFENAETDVDADKAGDWCSAVLQVLGFEWV